MCMIKKGTNGIIHTRKGLRVVKSDVNRKGNYRVSLTRKTTKDGKQKYAVVLNRRGRRRHVRLRAFDTIGKAWELYKAMRAA